MSILKSFLSILAKASGNRFMQSILENNVEVSQYLMGVGAGGRVKSSGEKQYLIF